MPSPFPGMNPYFENPVTWQDFHTTFIVALRATLYSRIPKYYAKVEEHIYIREFDESSLRSFARADVAVTERQPTKQASASTATLDPHLVAEPKHVWLSVFDEDRVRAIEIVDRELDQVITVIELLSPTNKEHGKDREQFIARRHQLLKSGVHYVELDLLRGGPRLPWDGLEPCDYYFLVSRAGDRPRADIWPFGMREAFPLLHVPLGPGDDDVVVDLKKLLDAQFDAVGYAQIIYENEPVPPLSEQDQAWALSLIEKQ
jgi:hypothetical protein